MSAESPNELAGWDGVCRSLEQIRASHQEFDHFFSGVFDELDALAADLVQRQQAWLESRRQAENELSQRAAELERQGAALVAQWERLQQSAARPAEPDPAAEAERQKQLDAVRWQAEQGREALMAAIEAAQAQAAQLAEVVRELGQARSELAEARQEMLRQQQIPAAPAAAPSPPDDRLLEQLRQTEEERRALEQERAVLESELESVRNRAAEMAETLAQQKRQMAEQRDQWAEELRRMRHLLEALTGRLAETPSAPRPAPTETPKRAAGTPAGAAPPGGTAGDSVLDSVMAQFQMLQRDRARRREKPLEAVPT